MKTLIFLLVFVVAFGGRIAMSQQNPTSPPATQGDTNAQQGSDEDRQDADDQNQQEQKGGASAPAPNTPSGSAPSDDQSGKTNRGSSDSGY